MHLKAEACFDVLSIHYRLAQTTTGLYLSEIQLLSYLSCLLFLYDRHPVSLWGYVFTSTQSGAPFSHELNSAVTNMTRAGWIRCTEDRYQVTPIGKSQYDSLRSLTFNSDREKYLEAACTSTLSIPVTVVRHALSKEPSLSRYLKNASSARPLLVDADIETLYQHFDALNEVLPAGADQNLFVPSVVWLEYLAKSSVNHIPTNRKEGAN